MDRVQFLQNVRAAAAQGNAYRVHVDDACSDAGYVGGGDDLVGKLIEEINAVGGEAVRVADMQQAKNALAELLQRYGAQTALCWNHPVLERLGLDELLQSLGVRPLRYLDLAALYPEERREKLLAADIGITSATYAIAESGTLAMASEPGRERLASLLPPVHVAIIERAQILPDLFDLFARIEDAGVDRLPANWTLITGPSKTGDIELHLTTGVHGPGHWHVIVVDG